MKKQLAQVLVAALMAAPLGASADSTNTKWLGKFPRATSNLPLAYYEIPEELAGKTFTLYAWLATPKGSGPLPVVILGPGCNGFFGTAKNGEYIGAWPQYQFWSDWLAGEGYATLFLDSFTGRGLNQICKDGTELPVVQRAADIYAAAAYLAKLPRINPKRIAVLGDSHGGATTIAAAHVLGQFNQESEPARRTLAAAGGAIGAFVALYPNCKPIPYAAFAVPTLVLAGSADDWTPPDVCEQLANFPTISGKPVTLNTYGAPLTIVVYPGATHAFDVHAPPSVTPAGHHLRYDPIVTAQAQKHIKDFLDRYLK